MTKREYKYFKNKRWNRVNLYTVSYLGKIAGPVKATILAIETVNKFKSNTLETYKNKFTWHSTNV